MRLDESHLSMTAVDGEMVILDSRDSSYLTVNTSGVGLVELLRRGASLDELAQRLQERYDLEPDVALADSRVFLRQLDARGWLVESVDDVAADF